MATTKSWQRLGLRRCGLCQCLTPGRNGEVLTHLTCMWEKAIWKKGLKNGSVCLKLNVQRKRNHHLPSANVSLLYQGFRAKSECVPFDINRHEVAPFWVFFSCYNAVYVLCFMVVYLF